MVWTTLEFSAEAKPVAQRAIVVGQPHIGYRTRPERGQKAIGHLRWPTKVLLRNALVGGRSSGFALSLGRPFRHAFITCILLDQNA
ncbi:hypothetical protein N7462_002477 [Penicillium macrosclerotiorum]|uniref:uncharacterized protein n=1 Tax=Penicillium macrosclerotiorum TaxID=303699 RepID=UPI002548E599|nr:uncharacterized protein N7462_002477 [Penicillium macrosclerotiorum]KAJ5693054.1 hypothetical protein N7462_002477 [Penicillium macrosclerotiorum]